MVSVNTNAAAITALRTLQQTNATLDKTQNRISTGYKIGEAKDNAAYWAISTTLKSDNKSLGTVKDALGLGASTVDVAYQGLNKAKDVLDEIKAKITAATQDGVNRDTIQNEIKQLQDQLKSIATSSIFSGENWLSVDTSVNGFNPEKQVVASFSRDQNGTVSIGTIKVQTSTVALFDASTVLNSGGIVDGAMNLKGKDGRDLTIGGTPVATGNAVNAGLKASAVAGVPGLAPSAIAATGGALGTNGTGNAVRTYSTVTIGDGTGTVGDKLTVTVTKSTGGTQTFDVTLTGTTATSVLDDIRTAGAGAGLTGVTVGGTPGTNVTLTNSVSEAASYTMTIAPKSGYTNTDTYALTAAGAATGYTPGNKATVSTSALTTANFAVGDKITVTVDVNGTPTTVTTAALTGTAASDIATALDTALTGVADVSVPSSTILKFDAPTDGLKTAFRLVDFVLKDAAGNVKTAAGVPQATAGAFETDSFATVTLDDDDHLYFKVQVDDTTAPTNITIDKALIDKTLTGAGHVPGKIVDATEFASVLRAALEAANVKNVAVAVTNTDKITFSSKTLGTTSKIIVSDVSASQGGAKISVENIDISTGATVFAGKTSTEIKQILSAYIDVVNTAINKVTSAAGLLGSVAARIDLQKSFVDTLMDTIDKGVGGLIDADMSEESTKLQALQVKQQLGVQALSIANQSSQNILALFQSNG